MRDYISLINSKNFYVGDVEEVASGPYDGMTFVIFYHKTSQ